MLSPSLKAECRTMLIVILAMFSLCWWEKIIKRRQIQPEICYWIRGDKEVDQ